MTYDSRRPGWLVFAEHVEEGDPWIQLLMVNPVNGEMSTLMDEVICLDDEGIAAKPGARSRAQKSSRTEV